MPGKTELTQTAGDNSELYQGTAVTVHKYVFENGISSNTSALKNLVEAYKLECKTADPSSAQPFIDKLNYFMNVVDQQFKTLEEKLREGGFEADIDTALKLKEQYGMTLQKIKHINSAQKIHAYLLGNVLMAFQSIYHILYKGERPDNLAVKTIIKKQVIDNIENLINKEENALELYTMEIHSMIYYLTGNCHIKWS